MDKQSQNEQQIADLRRPDAEGVIAIDYACSKCQYNLRSLHTSANCPECGTPISQTLKRPFYPAVNLELMDELQKMKPGRRLKILIGIYLIILLLGFTAAESLDGNIILSALFFFSAFFVPYLSCVDYVRQLSRLLTKNENAPKLSGLHDAFFALWAAQLLCLGCITASVLWGAVMLQYAFLTLAFLMNLLFLCYHRTSLLYLWRFGFRQCDVNDRRAGAIIRILLFIWPLLGLVFHPPSNWLILIVQYQIIPFCVIFSLLSNVNIKFLSNAFEFNQAVQLALDHKPTPDGAAYFQAMVGSMPNKYMS